MIKQTVLPFKLETTRDLITSHAGLALMGEFAVGLGLNKALDRYLPAPGSGAGYLQANMFFLLYRYSMEGAVAWRTAGRSEKMSVCGKFCH